MNTTTKRSLTAALATAALALGGAAAHAAGSTHPRHGDATLARDFNAVDRTTAWQLTSNLKLTFPTFHTEGLAVAGNRIFLSAVQILEPTVPYPTPEDGYDRTPGKGIGHLFVLDVQGHLEKDIVLGEGDMYHPGGIDFDGHNVWVPVAQYRPNSSAIIYRVDAASLRVHKQFTVRDHFGGIVLDKTTGHLVGNTWGSRRFVEWNQHGRQLAAWANTSFFIDYQDCQYVPDAKMICGGVTNLPQTPTAGGTAATYELGGLALIDLHTHAVLREVPLQQWSTAGHVITRNPLKLAAHGRDLTLWAAPDNGDEGNGTEILTYRATVPR
jgi:uncharacterized protein DUF6454